MRGPFFVRILGNTQFSNYNHEGSGVEILA